MKKICLSFCLALSAWGYSSDTLYLMQDKKITSWLELRDKNLVRQKYDYTCGGASLATILHYFYHTEVDEKDVLDFVIKSREITPDLSDQEIEALKQRGLSFLDLSNFAQQKGFKAIGLALDFQSLKQLKVPAIVFLNIRKTEHFSVYKGVDEHYVYLADPSFGNIKISIKKFKKAFYQRDDSQHPGKILAILPKDSDTSIANLDFMKINKSSHFIEHILEEKSISKEIQSPIILRR